MLRTGAALRVLEARDLHEVLELLSGDPVVDCFVASRIQASGLDPWRLGAEVWGFGERGRLESLCYAGANLVPVRASDSAIRRFAEKARRQGRRCSSLVGPAAAVLALWELLRPAWGGPRELRPRQPLLAIERPPAVPADPQVRQVQPDELELLMPACVAMFTEEVGVSPLSGDGGRLYRARIADLVAQGRAYARIDRDRVVFKAEVGAATSAVCQVQGVWVDPRDRGRGLGTAGMAAVVAATQASLAPVCSLYVNDYNKAARRSYERVGFAEVGVLASVLF